METVSQKETALKGTTVGLVAVAVGLSLLVACSRGDCGQETATRLAAKGARLSQREADKLEHALVTNEFDVSARTLLLGYYFHAYDSSTGRSAHQSHVMWIIQNRARCEVAGIAEAQLNAAVERGAYEKARTLWLEQVQLHGDEAEVLGNGGRFLMVRNSHEAEGLLARAAEMDPLNSEWPRLRARLFRLEMIGARDCAERRDLARKSIRELEHVVALRNEEGENVYLLSDLAETALEAGDEGLARSKAEALLAVASDERNCVICGEFAHRANVVLGRVALHEGDLGRAEELLLEAGRARGGPGLNSSGPDMTLARELLERGGKDGVLQYLKLCLAFWESGRERIENWILVA